MLALTPSRAGIGWRKLMDNRSESLAGQNRRFAMHAPVAALAWRLVYQKPAKWRRWLDIGLSFSYIPPIESRPRKGRRRRQPTDGASAVPAGGACNLALGRSGHRPRRH